MKSLGASYSTSKVEEGGLDHDKWLKFLGASLLTGILTVASGGQYSYESVVDNRYIGHSLLRGTTGLRIITNGTKTFTPRVVALI